MGSGWIFLIGLSLLAAGFASLVTANWDRTCPSGSPATEEGPTGDGD